MAGPAPRGGEPARLNPLQRLRARLAARPDTEHEQGVLRLIITALGALYLQGLWEGVAAGVSGVTGGTGVTGERAIQRDGAS